MESFVRNIATGKKMDIIERNGVFVMDVEWMEIEGDAKDFRRQA